MADVTYREARLRYRRGVAPAFIAYGVACIGGALVYKSLSHPPVWAAASIAVLAVAPLFGVMWLTGRFLRETDEYTRQRQSEAMLTAGAITLSLTMLIGFLQLYDVVAADPLWMLMVWPAFFLIRGAVTLVQQRSRGEPAGIDCSLKDVP